MLCVVKGRAAIVVLTTTRIHPITTRATSTVATTTSVTVDHCTTARVD